jgi:uncharacterized protein
MATNYEVIKGGIEDSQSREVIFAGDGVCLAGQVDYPADAASSPCGYPLIFVLHHAGGNTRRDYDHYAHLGLNNGFVVFRWDKRGTGKSGAGGRGSPLQDAINAYQTALSQPGINKEKVIILAQGEGTLMLSDLFEDFAKVQQPYAALLVGNLLDKDDVVKIKTRVQIIIGANDWISWELYGRDACAAHNESLDYGARFSVAHHADRLLIDTRYPDQRIHIGAKQIIKDWLQSLG